MMSNTIEISGVQEGYLPGENLSGMVRWNSTMKVATMEIRLFWILDGMAPRQIGVLLKHHFENVESSGTRSFAFSLPTGPWSFRGSQGTLQWAVEARLLQPAAHAVKYFTVGPGRGQVQLHRPEEKN
jgi:hypothetical protein